MITGQFFRSIEPLLLKELKLYELLSRICLLESQATVAMDIEGIARCGGQRVDIVSQVQLLVQQRREVVEAFAGGMVASLEKYVLSSPLDKGVPLPERARFIKLIQTVRERAQALRHQCHELAAITHFSLSMANGCLSIINSARQTQCKTYTRSGNVAEQLTPRYSRSETTLAEA